ncbi:hypothetical protein RHSIM_Rhsim13G0171800 [Rhododendron simsii]|uniref:F-box domain-containing protein n=1 Tax=Rhododendron simsii TaxID=118357 RepID=A0A834FXD0_RHOSS|nr:hypothetical protein RHSIM_Rhsim13G0171800 [Rhododendron simsii]
MSSPSNSEHNSVSEYVSSADSDDRPLGQQSIHDSDSKPSENSGSDRQVSESSCNSDSDRQVIGENSHSIRRRGKRNRQVSLVSDESSPEQRRRKPAVDLFTALPDSLFLHVLSFLPIVDAVKTQVLSKRCQYLWTYITSLVFSIRNAGRCDRDFVAFVDKTLVISNCSKIKKLGVQFGYALDYESSVDLWTQFAAGKRAEELQLAFEDAVDPYYRRVVRWNSLKRLSIGHANLSEDVIQKILAGSPVLEILELYRCLGFTRLHVNNASVKKLKLRHVWVEDPSGLEISASQLHSLEVSGRLYDRICRLGNVSSLVDANLNFHERIHGPYSDDDFERYSNMLRGLLQSLVHVKKMTLGTWALQVGLLIILCLCHSIIEVFPQLWKN